jgi:hypothetical protein
MIFHPCFGEHKKNIKTMILLTSALKIKAVTELAQEGKLKKINTTKVF